MSVSNILPVEMQRTLKRQVPSFVAIGLFGYVVDAGVTYGLVREWGVDPLLARFPAFALATVLNFALNRTLTFAHSTARLLPAFVRYIMVCAAGFVVNYLVYAATFELARHLGFAQTPTLLPLFVACGAGVAMFVTFFGFRFFAFRV